MVDIAREPLEMSGPKTSNNGAVSRMPPHRELLRAYCPAGGA